MTVPSVMCGSATMLINLVPKEEGVDARPLIGSERNAG